MSMMDGIFTDSVLPQGYQQLLQNNQQALGTTIQSFQFLR